MRTFLKIFVFLWLVIAALVFFAPASLLDNGLDRASQSQWRLTDAEGTLWNGSGLLMHAAQGAVITALRWRFEPSALLDGTARWRMIGENTAPSLSGVLNLHRNGIELEGLTLRTSAATLQPMLPPGVVQAMEGVLVIDTPSLLLHEKGPQGHIKGQWQNAQLVLRDVPVDLGNVAFNFESSLQGSHGTVKNNEGAIALDGDFQTDAAGKLAHGKLKITPKPATPEALLQLLSTLGQPDAQGNYFIEMR